MVRGLIAGKGRASRRHAAGLTYPVVLIALMVMSLQAMTAVPLSSTQAQRERESELLFRGQAYRQAIQSYYYALPGAPQYPASIEDLLRDPRFPMRRHLRQAYADPVSAEDWLLIQAPGGGIAGIASASTATPLKTGHFPAGLEVFEAASTYRDWQFVFVPGT